LASYIPDVVDGVVRGFFVLVADISERKRFELALRESEAKFSGIISIAADAIISVDESQRITIFNEGAERIFGYAKAEVMGAPLDHLLPARLREQHQRRVELFLAGEAGARQMGERDATIIGVRKNGEEFPAEAGISKLEINGKRLLTVALRDITERKRAETERDLLAEAGTVLAASLNYKQTLKAIAELVVSRVADLCAVDIVEEHEPVRLTITPRDPRMIPICEKLATLPVSRRHMLSWKAVETKRPQLLSDIKPEQLQAIAQSPEHLELIQALGPRSVVIVPMFSAGRMFGSLVLASTTPGRFQERDVAFAAELAHRAGLAIENARLYEAEQRATRARDEMLAVVAHDIRNPLAAVRLAATAVGQQLARDGSARGDASVQIILRSVDRATRLIQDLLDTSRMEAGTLSVDRSALAPNQILVEVAEAQQPLASSASLKLRLDASPQLPQIWADRARLLQVMENLVGNAIKFTPEGGCVTIGAATRAGEVLFWVADTGEGIPAEDLPRVFDRFWSGKRAERHGAGLGLAICKGIVEAHAGRIWVESLPGCGTTFYFTVPSAPPLADRRGEALSG
jgi:PAS domain S-box-containing protein